MARIAMTPPMGWNSWDCYGAGVAEDIVKANADYMASKLKNYGWEYVVVDIQWGVASAVNHEYSQFSDFCMDEYGRLIPAENKFPSSAGGKGFKPLADYVHSLGLKFGIHIMRGIPRMAVYNKCKVLGSFEGKEYMASDAANAYDICDWNPDMYGIKTDSPASQLYYDSIFKLYAEWGVDYIKIDDIARDYPVKEVEMVAKALKNSGREMVLSLSPGPAKLEEAEHLKTHANMWRITDDFWDQWELLYAMFERAEKWCTHSGPGHWPDADMLPIGALRMDYPEGNHETGFTEEEQKTMFTLWCIMRSPMMMGGDMVHNDEFTEKLLTKASILEMLTKGRSSHQVYKRKENDSEVIVWSAVCSEGGKYLAVFNTGEKDAEFSVSLEECEVEYFVKSLDLWNEKEITVSDGILKACVKSHGAACYKFY